MLDEDRLYMISNLSLASSYATRGSRHRSLPSRGGSFASPTTAAKAHVSLAEEMMKQSWTVGVLRCAVVALALLPWLSPRPAAAQAARGTILGTVRDSTGAALPGATGTLTNTGTGFTRSVVADASGEYTAPL